MRQPTDQERQQETAFFYTAMADVGILLLLLMAAAASGSLTIFAEAVRASIMIFVVFTSLWLMLALHRGKLTRYEFGHGKIEQLIWVVVGLSLLFGAGWILVKVAGLILGSGYTVNPLGLALAACVNAVNLVINFLGWHAMVLAAKGRDDGIIGAEISSRFGVLVGSAVLQLTLTLSILASDLWLVFLLDLIGALIVMVLTVKRGVMMIGRGLPDLLDTRVDPALRARLAEAIESISGNGGSYRLRTRKSGGTVFAEVRFDEPACHADWSPEAIADHICSHVHNEQERLALDISVVTGAAANEG